MRTDQMLESKLKIVYLTNGLKDKTLLFQY